MRLQLKPIGCWATPVSGLSRRNILRGGRGKRRTLNIAAGEGQKCRPVRSGCVPAAMLTKGDLAVDEGGFDGREFSGPQVPFAEKPVYGSGGDCGEEHALGSVQPSP